MRILTQKEAVAIPDWHEQLAHLVQHMWLDDNGKCLFPYLPLTTGEYWQDEIAKIWAEGKMLSWMAVVGGRIIAHASLINKGEYWELGRMNSYESNPKGTMLKLCQLAMEMASQQGWRVLCEATQRHTSSQHICRRLGMRFAGLGFLTEIDSVNWDILYFDNNSELSDFEAEPGILANPLGSIQACTLSDRLRLQEIEGVISTEKKDESFPPKRFHILGELKERLEQIISRNIRAHCGEKAVNF